MSISSHNSTSIQAENEPSKDLYPKRRLMWQQQLVPALRFKFFKNKITSTVQWIPEGLQYCWKVPVYIVSGKWILSQDTVDGQIQINISNTGTNADCTSYVRSAGLHCDSLMGEIPTTLKSHVLFFSYFFPTLLHFFNARVIIFSSSSFRDSTKWTHCDLLFAPASTSSHIQSCNHFRWYLTIFSSSPLLLSLKPLQPRSRFPTRLPLSSSTQIQIGKK